jgi:hypothetical protein
MKGHFVKHRSKWETIVSGTENEGINSNDKSTGFRFTSSKSS